MNLPAIRGHLCAARLALGAENPLASRILMVERNLTPGDPLWCNDAVSAQGDLLGISADLEQQPLVTAPRDAMHAGEVAELAHTKMPPGLNEAIKQIAEAIELL